MAGMGICTFVFILPSGRARRELIASPYEYLIVSHHFHIYESSQVRSARILRFEGGTHVMVHPMEPHPHTPCISIDHWVLHSSE